MLIAGNWKMNTDRREAVSLVDDLKRLVGEEEDVQIAVCPPFVHLGELQPLLDGTSIALGAQNMHFEDEGAFTGEISASMLREVGCVFVILGHSERRQSFNETYVEINAKVKQALSYGLKPIVCVGEALAQRKAGQAEEIVRTQASCALEGVTLTSAADLVLAYEPIWAIGTGETATPEQAQSIHATLRQWLIDSFPEVGHSLQILYGGSMKPQNAADLLAQPDINGGLVGGASLKADDFAAIVEAGRRFV